MKAKLLTLFFCSTLCYSQSPQQVLSWINTAKAENTNFYYEIPFDYRNNLIVIPVRIGGQAYDYIFDTGGYNNITDPIQKKNNFPVLTKQTVGSSNKLKSEINIVRVDTFAIGDLIFKDIAALQLDFSKSPTIQCTIDGGIIGASIIKNYIWQIDYTRKKIIVTDRIDKITGLEKAVRVPVTFNSRLMPYINIEIGDRTENVMFDLGSSTLFSMTKKAAKRYHKSKEAILVQGGGTEGANGTIKEDIHIFKAPKIQLGLIKFENKPVLYTDTNNESLIGNPIIKNYIVTLNFAAGEMFFLPIKESPVEEGWKSLGFTLKRKNKRVQVATLYKGLAADKAGLLQEDEITAIDGKPITCDTDCDCNKMFPEMLDQQETITLTVLRNNAPFEIAIKKEKVY